MNTRKGDQGGTLLFHSHQSKHTEKQARPEAVPEACIWLSLTESWSWWIRHTLQNNKDQAAFSETYCREINCPLRSSGTTQNQFRGSCSSGASHQCRMGISTWKYGENPRSISWFLVTEHKLKTRLQTIGEKKSQCHKIYCQHLTRSRQSRGVVTQILWQPAKRKKENPTKPQQK